MYGHAANHLCVWGSCRGTDGVLSPHGIPIDLLDRMLIIRTLEYTEKEIAQVGERGGHALHHSTAYLPTCPLQILSIRALVEGITVDDEALAALAAIGARTTLRYAVQMLTPGRILASTQGRDVITVADVNEVDTLFLDAKRSGRKLADNAGSYLQ